jgi:FKBP-type peptidyl-prolyl cis-trans isomerase SlpA
MGDGSLLPGFEQRLLGMRPGERKLFQVPPEDAFGQPNENNVQRIDRDNFDDDIELELGLVCSFADAAGGEVPGMIVGFRRRGGHGGLQSPARRAYYSL